MFFYDVESVGFTGPIVLLQYQWDDGPIVLHETWRTPIKDTLELIEKAMDDDVIGFNMTFDHFHLCKDYSIMRLARDCSKPPNPKEYLANERRGSQEAVCLKPRNALDLMLHVRKGTLQALMARRAIRIRKIPHQLAQELADHLTANLEMEDIFFARRQMGYKWEVDTKYSEFFPDVVLKFAPAGGLKPLVRHLLGHETLEMPLPKEMRPEEHLWSPFAEKSGGWPSKLPYQIVHWQTDRLARKYAHDDVRFTHELWEHFDYPEPGDDESTLACAVGAARWRGFAVNLAGCDELLPDVQKKAKAAPTYSTNVRRWLAQVCSEMEMATIKDTKDNTLEMLTKWRGHPVAERARAVQEARSAEKQIDTLKKLKHAQGWYPDFVVVGTKTDRMAGTGKFNAQGIPRVKYIRDLFTLAGPGEKLDGGDFSSFEVSLAAAAWNDPQLTEDLKSGKKIHALFGSENYMLSDLNPNIIPDSDEDRPLTYDEVAATAATTHDLYGTAKNGVFALIFGAMPPRLASTLGVPLHRAEKGFEAWWDRYPEAKRFRQSIFDDFTALSQPGGIGTQVVWKEPAENISTLLGFKRWFSLEWKVAEFLFALAQSPPKDWSRFKIKVVRRAHRGEQTPGGALRSALYAASFGLQGDIQRQAANTVIQGTGAQINKQLQLEAWKLQPQGVHEFKVRTLNVHDETLVVHSGVDTRSAAEAIVERYRPQVPLLGLDWSVDCPSWGSLKG